VKTRYIEVPRRRPTHRYKHCRCRKNVSPIADTFHAPLTRLILTALTVITGVAHLPALFAVTLLAAIWAWRHR
jgi:hypothetical protein